jgi:Fur family ferric uptake transcriptional regulator
MGITKKDLNKVMEACFRKPGMRMTVEREEILREVIKKRDHFDAEHLYEELRRKGIRTSRATVYRTLPLLASCGIIREEKRTAEGVEYEVTYGREHHDHLRCLGCGRIIEFTCPAIEVLQKQVCQKQGFEQTGHHHEITGYCKRCQRKLRG